MIEGIYALESIHRINPATHTMDDFYLKQEVAAIVRLLQPMPTLAALVELKARLRQRIDYVMDRQIVSFV